MRVRSRCAVEGKGSMYLPEAFDMHPRALGASFGLLPSRVDGLGTHNRQRTLIPSLGWTFVFRRADGCVIR